MTHNQKFRQHAERISSVASLNDGVEFLGIEREIIRSWQRCLSDDHLDPFKPRSPNVLEPQSLHELRSRFEAFIRLSEPELANLASALSGSGYAVILTDNKGLILHHQVEDNLADEFRKAGLWQGADWGEEHVGTNGIGTCISEMRPVTVHRDEHFLRQNIDLSCSASPILDPHGNLLTVLDASCCGTEDSRASQIHTRALVVSYARLIEGRYFLREFRNQRVLRFHSRVECVALPNEAMLALSEDNRILAANIVALQLLGIQDRNMLVGMSLSDLVGNDLDSLLFASKSNEGTVLPFRHQESGARFFGFIYKYKEPAPLRGLTIKPATQSPDECRGELCNLNKLAGEDPQMLEAAKRALRVVDKRIPILLQGETGTGKDLFSQAMHKASKRKDKPFVALNCASIPESLIESELFGYKHGAFTGARKEGRRGKLIESSGGTLFLDEIGDMPLNMQSRLLRVLETEEVVPLGAEQLIKVDLNIVAATHRDLIQLINEGAFREDLYYRLNGITLYLPPLRERQDLRNIILKVLEAENDTGKKLQITPEAISHLLKYPWPGNLRQLRNVIRTAVALCDGDVIDVSHINLPTLVGRNQNHAHTCSTDSSASKPRNEDLPPVEAVSDNPLRSAEHTVILNALKTYNWNITRTAEALDMSRNTLYRKIQKHNIKQDN
ncbi:MAG: sigma-54-dependent Fis family transcriptional regulator [Candidatus Thiodiazotropha sp. (ex Codakia orbicularis)]|nr:sigma-54-dependent Fis family transcriptional regulator [Candidatus Thiodiazotropha sp. (ex Lucina pensylvanica)]MBT3049311.1 sigma-54-dependent Fis family transcriptional regulator [Candidatus Thiodiazotropha sp. (ex Codakia orbicularis)]MBT3054378.1 sigma-54-dependent Fis family transcriptional regulator [Candidatus Thiodiazotropha sp. (ex Codakia orbicularis)]